MNAKVTISTAILLTVTRRLLHVIIEPFQVGILSALAGFLQGGKAR
jgi:hypothetical protein